jgi:hypothetical protein
MKKIKLGGCGYLYQKTESKHTLIADPKDEGWYEYLKGKQVSQIEDTGNGIEFTQRNKNRLDYDEAQELLYLLKKVL